MLWVDGVVLGSVFEFGGIAISGYSMQSLVLLLHCTIHSVAPVVHSWFRSMSNVFYPDWSCLDSESRRFMYRSITHVHDLGSFQSDDGSRTRLLHVFRPQNNVSGFALISNGQ